MRGQFAYKVVNACLRARLHSLDDANIDPILFVHIASLHEPPYRALLLLPSMVRLASVVLFSKTCARPGGTSLPIAAVLCLEQHRRSSG